MFCFFFFFSSRRRHTRWPRDWSSDVCSSDLFLASGTAKYLLGTPGIDFLYVRQGLREQLEPTVTGWFGRTDPFAFDAASLDYAPTARRFDLGSPPVLPAAVAECAMDAIREAGPGRIRTQVETLVAAAIELGGELGLRVLGPKV